MSLVPCVVENQVIAKAAPRIAPRRRDRDKQRPTPGGKSRAILTIAYPVLHTSSVAQAARTCLYLLLNVLACLFVCCHTADRRLRELESASVCTQVRARALQPFSARVTSRLDVSQRSTMAWTLAARRHTRSSRNRSCRLRRVDLSGLSCPVPVGTASGTALHSGHVGRAHDRFLSNHRSMHSV